MNKEQKGLGELKEFFQGRYLGVLATQDRGQPYTSLMAFAATDDMKQILFATDRATRKFANLTADGRAAMLIDNRSNRYEDIAETTAVTATGTAAVVTGEEKDKLEALYLAKHPYLEAFIAVPSTALVSLNVDSYFIVSKFQDVTKLRMKE
ncbi:MAG: pyridoxamine 5'-phosphate oxidase family protein [Deltaproteobacteria bacterium]|nr:pyridoxamine 5'-phosphate oxidase family protein [Deltaproteobacteria bacterium]MBN2688296.1 pyridoxamine 5'-phosphate oxidase family protein [Deltaproteobacteria bacterium]